MFEDCKQNSFSGDDRLDDGDDGRNTLFINYVSHN